MTIRFVESGGQYHANNGAAAGVWGADISGSMSITSSAPLYNGSTWAYNGGNATFATPILGAGYTGMVAGYRFYTGSISALTPIGFFDSGAIAQCDLRINISGLFFFTQNGTQLGSLSTVALVANAWNYIEFAATLSHTGSGTCTAYLNNTQILTVSSVTNAANTNGCSVVRYSGNNTSPYLTDFYALDTGTGVNTTPLGDVTIGEIYPTGAGVNSAWTPNVGPFSITSVAVTTGVYTGAITGGASNAYQGYFFTMSLFAQSTNNGTFLCTASSATTLTLLHTTASDTTGSAAFQNPVQIGIEGGLNLQGITNNGTRPNGDVVYISDATTNDISDFSHQALSLSGTLKAIVHVTCARKDDAGTRQISQTCISTGTSEVGATIPLTSSYVYYQDVLEVDPHTSSAWTVSGFNAATFGVKEIT